TSPRTHSLSLHDALPISQIGVQHDAGGVDNRSEGRSGEPPDAGANPRAPAPGRGAAAVSAGRLDGLAHGAHHEAARPGGRDRRDLGLGEQGVHGGQATAWVGHGGLGRALVVSVGGGAGLGTGTTSTPCPSADTPLKLVAPRTRTRYLPPGASGWVVWTTRRSYGTGRSLRSLRTRAVSTFGAEVSGRDGAA